MLQGENGCPTKNKNMLLRRKQIKNTALHKKGAVFFRAESFRIFVRTDFTRSSSGISLNKRTKDQPLLCTVLPSRGQSVKYGLGRGLSKLPTILSNGPGRIRDACQSVQGRDLGQQGAEVFGYCHAGAFGIQEAKHL